MTYLMIQPAPKEVAPQQNFEASEKGSLDGKSVILIDHSYQQKKGFKAGMDSRAFEECLAAIFVAGCLFTTVIATIAVAISSRSFKHTAITLGIGLGITGLFSLSFCRTC